MTYIINDHDDKDLLWQIHSYLKVVAGMWAPDDGPMEAVREGMGEAGDRLKDLLERCHSKSNSADKTLEVNLPYKGDCIEDEAFDVHVPADWPYGEVLLRLLPTGVQTSNGSTVVSISKDPKMESQSMKVLRQNYWNQNNPFRISDLNEVKKALDGVGITDIVNRKSQVKTPPRHGSWPIKRNKNR